MLRTQVFHLAGLFKQTNSDGWAQWLTGSWGADTVANLWPGEEIGVEVLEQWLAERSAPTLVISLWRRGMDTMASEPPWGILLLYHNRLLWSRRPSRVNPKELPQRCVKDTRKGNAEVSEKERRKEEADNGHQEGHTGVDPNCLQQEYNLRILEKM